MKKRKGEELNMNRELTSRRIEYPEVAKDAPKDLKPTYTRTDPKERLRSIHGYPGSRSEDRIDAENLEDLRARFTAEVGDFRKKRVYQDIWKERILLKDVKMRDSDKLLTDQLWKDTGKWTHGLNVGDVIAFDAMLKKGIPMNPKNVTLIKPVFPSKPGAPPVQLEMF